MPFGYCHGRRAGAAIVSAIEPGGLRVRPGDRSSSTACCSTAVASRPTSRYSPTSPTPVTKRPCDDLRSGSLGVANEAAGSPPTRRRELRGVAAPALTGSDRVVDLQEGGRAQRRPTLALGIASDPMWARCGAICSLDAASIATIKRTAAAHPEGDVTMERFRR